MKTLSISAGLFGLALLMSACGRNEPTPAATKAAAPPPAAAPQAYVVEVRAVGKTFEMPVEMPSGWTTFRFVNASPMLHFGLIDVPPEGVSIEAFSEDLTVPFQDVMDAMNAGDEEGVNAAFGKFPAWIGELGRAGGPGFLSPGLTGQTTVFLEPGRYVMECYVKSGGVFHTTPPAPGELGMVLEFNVTETTHEAPEPDANATLTITNAGYELSGSLQTGVNTIRVDFAEQQALPSFVGNDVHLMWVDRPERIAQVDAWMDWRAPNGLEDPTPAIFLGGINDLPAGRHGYFTVKLEPGDYAFVAEMPNPGNAGFVLPFTID